LLRFVYNIRIELGQDGISKYIVQHSATIEGFSGREISKLLLSLQNAIYGSPSGQITAKLIDHVVTLKTAEHHRKSELTQQR
jgi:hypothetical protein